MIRKNSHKKQTLIDQLKNEPFIIGEEIYVDETTLNEFSKSNQKKRCNVVDVKENTLIVNSTESVYSQHKEVSIKNCHKDTLLVGANPFDKKRDSVRMVAFQLESIIHTLNLMDERGVERYDMDGVEVGECNWNPFVYNKKGEKEYYQRPFVWSLEDKKLLVESIYQGIDCGKVLVRLRGWDELKNMQSKGETELFFKDIVDGKQRLNAIKEFLEDKYTDLHGNYYSDLSYYCQHKFLNHQLFSYAEIPENSKDEDVIIQFLKLNFCGVPQSKEHIEFVKSLREKL